MMHAPLSMVIALSTIGCMKEMGKLVKDGRKAHGYRTIKAFADEIGKDPSWVSKLERGLLKEMPPPEEINRLSELVGVPVFDLLRGAGYRLMEDEEPTQLHRRAKVRRMCNELGVLTETQLTMVDAQLQLAKEIFG